MPKKSNSSKELQKNIISYLNKRNKKRIASIDEMYGNINQSALERYFLIDITHPNDEPLPEAEVIELIRTTKNEDFLEKPYSTLFTVAFGLNKGAPRISDRVFLIFLNKFIINETDKKLSIDIRPHIMLTLLRNKIFLDINKIVMLIDNLIKCNLFTSHNNIGVIKNVESFFSLASIMTKQDEEYSQNAINLKQKYYAGKEKNNLNNYLKSVAPAYTSTANKSKI